MEGGALRGHVSLTYRTEDERRRAMVGFLTAGLERGERLLYVAADPDRDLRALEAGAFRVADFVREGRLAVASTAEAYFRGGAFDADARVRAFAEEVDGAMRAGFSGLCIAADATAILEHPTARDTWTAYELRADLLATRLPFAALCAYDERRSDPRLLAEVDAVHRHRSGGSPKAAPFRLHAEADRLVLEGEVDLTCADRVRELLASAGRDLGRLPVDISGLAFADVAGIRALVAASRQAPVQLLGASPTFRRAWAALDCDGLDTIRLADREASGGEAT
ncbi:MAG TPA: MEDS domain-containing protein [Gaiellaceae bacterium]|nr:MEDS domain-containing protein [Gaiellaceae bacterium]